MGFEQFESGYFSVEVEMTSTSSSLVQGQGEVEVGPALKYGTHSG